MAGTTLLRILRSIGWVFGGGAGLLIAAIVLVVADTNLLALALILVAGGAALWAVFATAALVLLVELAEAPRKKPTSGSEKK
jgi:hypothetical protein